jgi:FkbM family methyltransferase
MAVKVEDVLDYFRLKNTIRNRWAFVRSRKRIRSDELFEIIFEDGRTFRLRPGTRDRHTLHRVLLRDEYGLRQIQGKLDCVIDVGGNVGAFSFLVAPIARRVLAFEPISDNFELLSRNLSGPQFSHVSCVRAAVTGEKKEVKIFKSSAGSGSHSAYPRAGADSSFESVPGLSLEHIFEDYHIDRCDLLKLDCEGAEYEILFFASDDIISRISAIVMEYHHVPGGDPSWKSAALREYLETKGFNVSARPGKRRAEQGLMICRR